jgi:threonylcarbamoyladenosine tRNA methylthiotransferase MtaB
LVVSFGCKVSRVEGWAIARELESDGARPAAEGEAADLVVVHACTVTGRAERDARKEIRRLRRENPDAEIVVSGCLARHAGESLARMPEVDLVDPERGAGFALDAPEIEPGRTRAFLKVQDGCERRCAYCVLPFLRGRERSAGRDEVLAAIRRLDDLGIPEVVLTGIHLAAFGDRNGGLLALLSALEAEPPSCRVRLSSLEPMEAGPELVDRIASSRVVAPHLHLPLQSGSDAVLKRMRRGMTRARFDALVRRAVSRNARLHVATDLIAGFPGETDSEFSETLDFVASLPIASIHAFPFSPRPGTEGEALHRSSPVDARLRGERAARLRRLGRQKLREFTLRSAGTVADVVALHGGAGLTDHYLGVDLVPRDGGPRQGSRFQALLEAGTESGRLRALPLRLPSRTGPTAC